MSQYRTTSLRVRTAAIGFVVNFLRHPGAYLQKVADYVYDEDYVDHEELRKPGPVHFGHHELH